MDLMDNLEIISERIKQVGEMLKTEEAVKTSLILPFISALGYDIHNPMEVIPEFTADVGIKKGEKVDYAIQYDNQIVFLIECKKIGEDLDSYKGQLFRYFSVTDSKVAILTNGIVYNFYSDLEENNKLDATPFYTLNLLDLKNTVIRDLPKITKKNLDPDGLLLIAQDLKYINEIKNILKSEFKEPTWLASELISHTSYKGKRTRGIVGWFSDLTKRSLKRIEENSIKERLNLSTDEEIFKEEEDEEEFIEENNINTTLYEYEGFHYIKAISSNLIDHNRVYLRDTQSYCGILLDNNNRKPICRLHFNNENKLFFSIGRNKEKKPIEDVIDLLKFKEEIIDQLKMYEDE